MNKYLRKMHGLMPQRKKKEDKIKNFFTITGLKFFKGRQASFCETVFSTFTLGKTNEKHQKVSKNPR